MKKTKRKNEEKKKKEKTSFGKQKLPKAVTDIIQRCFFFRETHSTS